jgi:hypothetical protein
MSARRRRALQRACRLRRLARSASAVERVQTRGRVAAQCARGCGARGAQDAARVTGSVKLTWHRASFFNRPPAVASTRTARRAAGAAVEQLEPAIHRPPLASASMSCLAARVSVAPRCSAAPLCTSARRRSRIPSCTAVPWQTTPPAAVFVVTRAQARHGRVGCTVQRGPPLPACTASSARPPPHARRVLLAAARTAESPSADREVREKGSRSRRRLLCSPRGPRCAAS